MAERNPSIHSAESVPQKGDLSGPKWKRRNCKVLLVLLLFFPETKQHWFHLSHVTQEGSAIK